MTWNEANTAAYQLWSRWVSDRPHQGIHNGFTEQADYKAYDLDRIHASMLQEARWHATGKSTASPALISEVKGELVLLGRVRKALAKSEYCCPECAADSGKTWPDDYQTEKL